MWYKYTNVLVELSDCVFYLLLLCFYCIFCIILVILHDMKSCYTVIFYLLLLYLYVCSIL